MRCGASDGSARARRAAACQAKGQDSRCWRECRRSSTHVGLIAGGVGAVARSRCCEPALVCALEAEKPPCDGHAPENACAAYGISHRARSVAGATGGRKSPSLNCTLPIDMRACPKTLKWRQRCGAAGHGPSGCVRVRESICVCGEGGFTLGEVAQGGPTQRTSLLRPTVPVTAAKPESPLSTNHAAAAVNRSAKMESAKGRSCQGEQGVHQEVRIFHEATSRANVLTRSSRCSRLRAPKSLVIPPPAKGKATDGGAAPVLRLHGWKLDLPSVPHSKQAPFCAHDAPAATHRGILTVHVGSARGMSGLSGNGLSGNGLSGNGLSVLLPLRTSRRTPGTCSRRKLCAACCTVCGA